MGDPVPVPGGPTSSASAAYHRCPRRPRDRQIQADPVGGDALERDRGGLAAAPARSGRRSSAALTPLASRSSASVSSRNTSCAVPPARSASSAAEHSRGSDGPGVDQERLDAGGRHEPPAGLRAELAPTCEVVLRRARAAPDRARGAPATDRQTRATSRRRWCRRRPAEPPRSAAPRSAGRSRSSSTRPWQWWSISGRVREHAPSSRTGEICGERALFSLSWTPFEEAA